MKAELESAHSINRYKFVFKHDTSKAKGFVNDDDEEKDATATVKVNSLTHLLTHSLTHLTTYLLTFSLTHLLKVKVLRLQGYSELNGKPKDLMQLVKYRNQIDYATATSNTPVVLYCSTSTNNTIAVQETEDKFNKVEIEFEVHNKVLTRLLTHLTYSLTHSLTYSLTEQGPGLRHVRLRLQRPG